MTHAGNWLLILREFFYLMDTHVWDIFLICSFTAPPAKAVQIWSSQVEELWLFHQWSSRDHLTQCHRAQPAVQFWKAVVLILTAKGTIFRSYRCSWRWGWGKQFHGDVKWLCILCRCIFFNGKIKWRLLCYTASHSGIMYQSPVLVFCKWHHKTFSSPAWGKCSFLWFKVYLRNNGTFPKTFD